MNKADVELWREGVAASQLLYDTKELSPPYDPCDGFEGNAVIDGVEVLLKVVLPSSFPRELPMIFLGNQQHLGQPIPHVTTYGYVCFQESEGIIMDVNRPLHIIEWSIKKAKEVISSGLRRENIQDFTDEFEVYWKDLDGETILNFFNPTAYSKELVLLHNTKDNIKSIAETEKDALDFWGLKQVWDKTTLHTATYVALSPDTRLIPPLSGKFWSVSEMQTIFKPAKEAMTSKQRRALFENKKSRKGYILFALPRFSSGYSLFGIQYQSADGTHPLSATNNNANIEIKPFSLKHCEKSFLVPRGGAIREMSSKKVLLIGCGSVGGHIANELIRSGVMNLTLVDHDKLALENIFRHVLGKSKFNINKAKALEEDLLQKYPFIKISSVDAKAEKAIEDKRINLPDFDLLIVAIGSPTVELWLNDQLYQLEREVPVIFTWLEPLGIGGHALVVRPMQNGCFKCLYASDDEELYLVNRASFAAPGQKFSLSLTGCNNLFTPYGSLDASKTAGIAVEAAIRVLIGKTQYSELLSWKGEADEFLLQGFKLSNRYSLSEENLKEQSRSFAYQSCPTCRTLNVQKRQTGADVTNI